MAEVVGGVGFLDFGGIVGFEFVGGEVGGVGEGDGGDDDPGVLGGGFFVGVVELAEVAAGAVVAGGGWGDFWVGFQFLGMETRATAGVGFGLDEEGGFAEGVAMAGWYLRLL